MKMHAGELSKNSDVKIVKFKRQIMVADNCFYIDSTGERHPLSFSEQLKRVHFVGPRGQDFILESSGSGDIKFYTLSVRRHGQQLMKVNDFVSLGQQKDFDNRKVGWVIDLNNDGIFDILQRDKLQIHRQVIREDVKKQTRTEASVQIYKSDIINFRIWDFKTKSYLESPFYTLKQKKDYYKKFDFKFQWRD